MNARRRERSPARTKLENRSDHGVPAEKHADAAPHVPWIWRPNLPVAIAVALLAAAAPLIAALLCFTPYYETNDDIGIDAALQGIIYLSKPSTTVCHPAFAWFVRALYDSFPDIPCYRVVCSVLHVAATTILLARLLVRGVDWLKLVGVTLFLVCFELYAHAAPQFTITACYAVGAGVASWLNAGFDERLDYRAYSGWAFAAAAIIGGGILLRSDAARFAIAVFSPIAMVECYARGAIAYPTWRTVNWRRVLLPMAPIGFILAASWAMAFLARPDLSDPYVARMTRFHRARVAILDMGRLPPPDKLPEVLKSIDWTYNDLDLLQAWCFADETVFSAERLEKLVEASPPSPYNLDERLQQLPELFRSPQSRVWLMLVLMAAITARQWGRCGIAIVGTAAIVIALSVFLFVFMRLPDRVMLPILSSTGAWLLIRDPNDDATPRGPWRQGSAVAWSLLAAYVCLWFVQMNIAFSARVSPGYRRAFAWMDRTMSEQRRPMIVIGAAYPFEAIPAWTPLSRLKHWHLLWIASDGAHSEAVKAQMKSMGIENVFRSIATDPNLIVVTEEGFGAAIARFSLERQELNPRFRQSPIDVFPFRDSPAVTLELIAER